MINYLASRKIIASIIIVYGLLLILNALGYRVWLPSCPIYTYTGVECLGCGINRAAIAVLRLDFHDALRQNPLIFLYMGLAVSLIIIDFRRYSKKNKPKTTDHG